jgi:hypothetical protein
MPFGFFVEVEGPVDPGFGGGGLPPHPSHGLPGVPPGSTLPEPPPGIWPPPDFTRPIVPIGPDNTLPVQPGTIWPSPGRPARPDQGLPGGGHISGQPIPGQPARPDQGLPGQPARPDNSLPSGKFWVVAGIPGVGWRYVCVDPSLEVGGGPMPGGPSRPDQTLPPTPEPKK